MDLRQYSMSAAQPGLSVEYIENLSAPLPPTETQRRIANYLDAQTAEIDALIAEKERMLTLLEEKRAAVITQAVTRGLDPHVKLKRSGFDWLEEVPEHWGIPRLKQIFAIRDERSDSGNEELLTVSHLTGVTPRSEKTVYMFKAEDMSGYKRCYPGDVVVNTLWAFMGAIGVAWQEGIVSPDYHVYKPIQPVVSRYVDFVCRSAPFKLAILRQSKGVWTSRLRLYPEEFFDIRFPLPSYDEQQAIVGYFREEFERDQLLKEQLSKSSELLRERRSALITATVTGQIPIEEMAA